MYIIPFFLDEAYKLIGLPQVLWRGTQKERHAVDYEGVSHRVAGARCIGRQDALKVQGTGNLYHGTGEWIHRFVFGDPV